MEGWRWFITRKIAEERLDSSVLCQCKFQYCRQCVCVFLSCLIEMCASLQDFEEFPEHRTNFFLLLQAVVTHCFPGKCIFLTAVREEGCCVHIASHCLQVNPFGSSDCCRNRDVLRKICNIEKNKQSCFFRNVIVGNGNYIV